jgi:hypothetical protein
MRDHLPGLTGLLRSQKGLIKNAMFLDRKRHYFYNMEDHRT